MTTRLPPLPHPIPSHPRFQAIRSLALPFPALARFGSVIGGCSRSTIEQLLRRYFDVSGPANRARGGYGVRLPCELIGLIADYFTASLATIIHLLVTHHSANDDPPPSPIPYSMPSITQYGVWWTQWQDPAIRNTYARRSEFQLFDGAAYMLDHVRTGIGSSADWIPSFDDILHCRSRTTGTHIHGLGLVRT